MSPKYWNQAIAELTQRDPLLDGLAYLQGRNRLQRRPDPFEALARAIISQQLSVKAARSIWQRLVEALGVVSPATVAASDVVALRRCGLSGNKCSYLIELAQRFDDGTLDETRWIGEDDEQVITQLTAVRGVGRWTAEMFLIFFLLRPDVLPLGDVGLQRAVSLHYNGGAPLSGGEIQHIAQPWRPWRSVATWLLWRSLDAAPQP